MCRLLLCLFIMYRCPADTRSQCHFVTFPVLPRQVLICFWISQFLMLFVFDVGLVLLVAHIDNLFEIFLHYYSKWIQSPQKITNAKKSQRYKIMDQNKSQHLLGECWDKNNFWHRGGCWVKPTVHIALFCHEKFRKAG